jgi:hypothetical protein
VFCDPRFLAAAGGECAVASVEDREKIVAGMIIMLGAEGHALDSSPPFIPYQGLLLPSLKQLAEHTRNHRNFLYTQVLVAGLTERFEGAFSLTHAPELVDVRPFLWHDYGRVGARRFSVEPTFTAILDIAGLDGPIDVLGRASKSRRQEVAKSEKECVVRESVDIETLDRLHELTFARQGIVREAAAVLRLRRIVEAAIDGGFGECLITYKDDIPVSAGVFLFDDRRTYYLVGATDPEYRALGAGTLTVVDGIVRACRRGSVEFDFVGVNSPGRGAYKLSFGPSIRPCLVTSIGSR